MIRLTAARIAEVVSGELAGGATPAIVVTAPAEFDSRKVIPGGLFVALPGERVDGHDYAAQAHAAGAVLVLASRPVAAPCVVVDDVLTALAALARHVASQLPGLTVVGITGSQGKTSVKDLVAQMLIPYGATIAPPGSFNNELGHPITVLRADETTKYLVLELGARGLGHISWLTEIARPNIGVVLNVGSAHVGKFGSIETTAQAKGELAAAVPRDGYAVLNADDARVLAMRERTEATTILFGRSADADVRASNVVVDTTGRASFVLETAGGQAGVQLQLVGQHHVSNALAAAAVGISAGLPVDGIAAALSDAVPRSAGRMQVVRRGDGITVIDDAYNANPESMRAAVRALRDIATPHRRWAVLGYMAELGAAAASEHEQLGAFAAEHGVDRLIVVSEAAAGIRTGYTKITEGTAPAGSDSGEVTVVVDGDAAVAAVLAQWRPGDTILVKASHAAGLQAVAQALIAYPERARS